MPPESTVVLKPISRSAAEALAAGRAPDVPVAPDYPTEFSSGVGQHAGASRGLGPFFIHRAEDDVVLGEIGGAFVEQDTIEIGYAIVESVWGRGHATDAVRALVALASVEPGIARVVAHTPLDRPASGRVVEKAGFTPVGEVVDEHEGEAIRVIRWERDLSGAS
jgi:RimJ/RimL family protein N-acetyltransferase